MKDFLVLRFQGPLMAFGDVMVDELHPTGDLPGLSMVTGLLGNALGWHYQDTEKLQNLQDRLILASRADVPGDLLRDYQTAQLSSGDLLWQTHGGAGGRAGGFSGFFTVQRFRFYRAGASITALIGLRDGHGPSLDDLAAALKNPFRPLFLGRASCPPSEPLWQGEKIEGRESFEDILKACPIHPAAACRVTYPAEFRCEWPLTAEEAGVMASDPQKRAHVQQRQDLRRWKENIHAGSRFVWRGTVKIDSPCSKEGHQRS